MQAESEYNPLEAIVQQNGRAPVVERMRRLCQTMVIDDVGRPLQSDYDVKVTAIMAKKLHDLRDAANSAVRDLDASNELTFLRVQTKKNEIIIANEQKFAIVAVRTEKEV